MLVFQMFETASCFFLTNKAPTDVVAPIAQLALDRLSDAEGPRFESQAGRCMGKSTPSLWRHRRPAIKGLRPPEHHSGQFHPDKTTKIKPPPIIQLLLLLLLLLLYYIYIYICICTYINMDMKGARDRVRREQEGARRISCSQSLY